MMMFGVLFLTFLTLSHVMAEDIVVQVRQEVNGGGCGGGGGGGSGCGTNCGDSFKEEEEETVEPTPPTEETVVTTTHDYGNCDAVDEDGQYLAYTDSEVDYVYLTAFLSLPAGKRSCINIGKTMITSRPDVYDIIEQNIINCGLDPEVWVDLTENIDLDTNWVGTSLGDFSIPPDTSRPAGAYGVVIQNSNPTGFLKEVSSEDSAHILCYLDKN